MRLLCEADGCNAFSLGDPALTALKTYLTKHAKRYQRSDLARTFVVAPSGDSRVMAYATILCTQMRVDQVAAPDGVAPFPYKDYPALRLARLAVDHRERGKGLGGILVDFILGLALDQIVPNVGCRFLIVDAKPGSVDFYRKKGFSTIGTAPDNGEPLTLMFVDLHKVRT